MLETSARLLRLLSLLQSRREWSGSELADRLEVSTRTVRSDVDRLRGLGYPVHAVRGAAGGYRLVAGANLPPLLLDDDEAVAIAVGLRAAAGGAISGIEDASLRALTKLEQVLPARLRSRVNALQASIVRVPADALGPTVEPSVLTTLAAACRDHEQVRFRYRDHDGTVTRRAAEPHRLVNWGRRWYLVAWDVDRRDWRTFRIDRIEADVSAGPRFTPREPPEGGNVAAYVSRRVSSAAWRYRARIVVHAPAETVAARLTPAAGSLEPVDDQTCLLDTGADTLDTLAVHVGLLGLDFTVQDPPELVEHLRALAARYQRATAEARLPIKAARRRSRSHEGT
jgi:predicted DNA-binding transcriptional regulator YafY